LPVVIQISLLVLSKMVHVNKAYKLLKIWTGVQFFFFVCLFLSQEKLPSCRLYSAENCEHDLPLDAGITSDEPITYCIQEEGAC